MKLVAFGVILLFGCMIFSVQPGRDCAWAKGRVTRSDDTINESEKEQMRIRECETANRVKPNGDIKKISQLCGHALSLPKPDYPEEAKADRISGTVVVEIVTNEAGKVIWAKAISGPEALRSVSEKAGCRAKYSPTVIFGRAIQTESSIQYLFVLP